MYVTATFIVILIAIAAGTISARKRKRDAG